MAAYLRILKRLLVLVLVAQAALLTRALESSASQSPELSVSVASLSPGDPGSADVLLAWTAFNSELHYTKNAWPGAAISTGNSDPVLFYEAQYSISGADAWTPLSDRISGTTVVPGRPRSDRHEKQRVFTRVDAGQTISDGFFRLTLSHAGTSPLDMHQHTVTPPIAFDASAAHLKAALETLDVVSNVQVFRRALDAAAGTFEWTVLFDPPLDAIADHDDLPLLALYSESISAEYSGPSDQVAVQSEREGAFHDVVCVEDCQYVASSLPVGVTLAFRVRARFAAAGWSDWSRTSEPLAIPPTPLPRAPSSPELIAVLPSQFTIQWTANGAENDLFPVQSFHLQQRCGRDLSWRSVQTRIPPGRTGVTVATSSQALLPNTTCAFRVSATNANGVGPFSSPSRLFRTLAAEPGPPRRLEVLRDPLRLTWQPPTTDGGSDVVAYELHVRAFGSTTWTRVASSAVNLSERSCVLSETELAIAPYTRYVARVRARNAVGYSAFVESQDFLTDFRADGNTTTTTPATASQAKILFSASRATVANAIDHNYVHGVGNGGQLRGEDGESGVVLLFPITFDGELLDEQAFYFIGAKQSYHVPVDNNPRRQIVAVDTYAWGGGGGSGGKTSWGTGGGGAFARGVFRVSGGDRIEILVGGGGKGLDNGGRGGWNGGGDGGVGAFPGGGGGGASEVRVHDQTALVAAGGGGGGSSDYCCAHGGGGGGADPAEDGLHPDETTIPLDSRVTGVVRNEYHSVNVEGDIRDFVGLPARHTNLDFGRAASSADYTTLATGGAGASSAQPGSAGQPASYVVSRVGKFFVNADSGSLSVSSSLAAPQATPGRRRLGGKGQDGQDCGGGGGGGYYGGGGGGAGVDGAGGGGGSSYIATELSFVRPQSVANQQQEGVDNFTVSAVSSTSVTLSWKPPMYGFLHPVEAIIVEMANRSANENFRLKRVLPSNATQFTVDSLRPSWWYRFRVKPLFRDAAVGVYSDVRTVQTPPTPSNTWKRVSDVRSLDERTTHANSRFIDAQPLRRLPSARRGHSLTAFDDGFLYLFGGLSLGYACNQAHKAACITNNGVSNELWRFDTRTLQWLELLTLGGPPPAREKHTMAIVSSHLLLFGGRKDGVSDTIAALNDLWSLKIASTTRKTTTTLRDRESGLAIGDGRETFTIGNVGNTPDMCVADLSVTVDLTHACHQTLRIELFGPGPSTFPQRQQTATSPVDSQTVETIWSDPTGFGSGQQRVTPTTPSARSFPVTLQRPEMASAGTPCVSGARTLSFTTTTPSSGASRPLESLAVFRQLSAAGGWTLSVTDMLLDGYTGTLNSWDISFTLTPCVPSFTWINVGLVATGTPPTARFQHTAIVYQSSMFVFGGRSASDAKPLTDLYRLDYDAVGNTGLWTTLLPITTYRDKVFYHGRMMLLTPYDLLTVGQGLRARATTSESHVLTSPVFVGRKSIVEALAAWQALPIQVAADDGDKATPLARYWSSAALTSDSVPPRVYLFGGQDDTTLTSDLWVLELDQLTEAEPSADLETRRTEICTWRLANAALQQAWTASCGATAARVAATTATECSLDTLLLYAWCNKTYQTIQL